MLTEQALNECLQEADQVAGVCHRKWCRYGATVEDKTIRVHHNGIGASDSDDTVIYSATALALSPSQMSGRFKAWLESLHDPRAKHIDLNTGEPAKK